MEDLGERPTLDLVSAAFASRSMATQSPPEAAAEKLLKSLEEKLAAAGYGS